MADFVSGLAGGSLGDGDAHAPFGVLCHVRRHFQIPALRHKVSGVVSLVGTQGYRLPSRYLVPLRLGRDGGGGTTHARVSTDHRGGATVSPGSTVLGQD